MMPISQISGMPQISSAFRGWTKKITLYVVTQEVVEGLVTETLATICFSGVIQPLSKEAIALKPEGQRSWEWLQIHCMDRCLNLKTNDKIKYDNKKFKIMALLDYGLNGFVEYHAVRDYE